MYSGMTRTPGSASHPDVHLLTRLGIEYPPALRALYIIFTDMFAPPTAPRVRVPPMFKPWPQSLTVV